MKSFQTDKKKVIKQIAIQFLIAIAILVIFFIYEFYLVKKPKLSSFFYWLFCGLLIVQLFLELFKKRVFSILFDDDKREVVLLYKSVFSEEERKIIPYDEARIEFNPDSSILSWVKKSATLSFLKRKTEFCSLSSKKDGFSYEQFTEILDKAKTIT